MATILIDHGNEIGGSAEPKSEWTYLGQTTGNAEITIPDNATEVICYMTTSAAAGVALQFQFATVQDDIAYARLSNYITSANNAIALFGWTKNTRKANMYQLLVNGSNQTSTAVTKWYIKN